MCGKGVRLLDLRCAHQRGPDLEHRQKAGTAEASLPEDLQEEPTHLKTTCVLREHIDILKRCVV